MPRTVLDPKIQTNLSNSLNPFPCTPTGTPPSRSDNVGDTPKISKSFSKEKSKAEGKKL
jgi:hypothetical protein